MENEKVNKWRRIICVAIVIVIFCGFIIRLFDWQIVHGREYKDQGLNAVLSTVTSKATRGEIFDIDGLPYAVNETSYNIIINKLYLKDMSLNDVISRLFDILAYRNEKWIDELPIKIDVNEKYEFLNGFDTRLDELREYLSLGIYALPEDFIGGLSKKFDADNIKDKIRQRNLISVRYNMWRSGFNTETPYIFAENVGPEIMLILSEKTQDISSIEIQTANVRMNKNAVSAPHIVGALGSVSPQELEQKNNEGKTYAMNDQIGKFGVEKSFEDMLKGEAGKKRIQRNILDGNLISVLETEPAKPGDSIYLTLKNDYQLVANKALEENIKAARLNGELLKNSAMYNGDTDKTEFFGEDCVRGAAVMLRVSDNAVLASASYPGYDLEKYSEYDDYYIKLEKDTAQPFNNYALSAFAPGSSFKPLVALAALEEGCITQYWTAVCNGVYDYYENDVIHCMDVHGTITLHTALSHSCNVFFAETGRLLGINSLYLYAEKFGLGVKTGLEIEESTGTLAGRDSKQWFEGNAPQAAIGQSDNAFTPMQLATFASTIANNGIRYKTHVVDKIVNYAKDKVVLKNDPKKPEIVEKIAIDKSNFALVQQGMYEAVNMVGGTASHYLGSYDIPMAAKTGTAENSGSDHTTFICYAPYDEPEIAIAVILEHSAYGRYSMGVAKALLDAYFHQKTVEDFDSWVLS